MSNKKICENNTGKNYMDRVLYEIRIVTSRRLWDRIFGYLWHHNKDHVRHHNQVNNHVLDTIKIKFLDHMKDIK